MTTLTIELPKESYELLQIEAERVGDSIQGVAQKLLMAQLLTERKQVIKALHAAGLLTEPGIETKNRAKKSKASLEEVRAALDQTTGKPLSELIIEMRGPKE